MGFGFAAELFDSTNVKAAVSVVSRDQRLDHRPDVQVRFFRSTCLGHDSRSCFPSSRTNWSENGAGGA
jgi:hypothetical protein